MQLGMSCGLSANFMKLYHTDVSLKLLSDYMRISLQRVMCVITSCNFLLVRNIWVSVFYA